MDAGGVIGWIGWTGVKMEDFVLLRDCPVTMNIQMAVIGCRIQRIRQRLL